MLQLYRGKKKIVLSARGNYMQSSLNHTNASSGRLSQVLVNTRKFMPPTTRIDTLNDSSSSPGWLMVSPLAKFNALVESSKVPMFSSHVSSIGPSRTNHFFTCDNDPIIRAILCLSENWLVRSSAMVSWVRVESRNHFDTTPSTQTLLSGSCLPNNCQNNKNFPSPININTSWLFESFIQWFHLLSLRCVQEVFWSRVCAMIIHLIFVWKQKHCLSHLLGTENVKNKRLSCP